MKFLTSLAVLSVALLLGGFVTPIFAFLMGALIIDLVRRALPRQQPQPILLRKRPF